MEEGIMGLNPQMGMPQTQNTNQGPRPQDLEAFEQARKQIPSEELSQTVLDGVEEQDPEVVGAFKDLLQSIEMPEEVLMALKQLIKAVLENPEMYPQLVDALMQLGAEAEDIPPQFDPEFVSTLALALDQVRKTAPMPEEVQGFADGGEVSMKPIAKYMASLGRNGDTILAHINPEEARLLKAFGGSGTINPQTGLPEFFIKKLFKGVKNAVNGVVKGAKKVLKSKVGRLIATLVIAYYAGPYAAQAFGAKSYAAQAAAAAFAGSTGSSLLAGDGLKNSFMNGVKTAGITYATAPVLQATFGTPTNVSGPEATFGEKVAAGFKAPEGQYGSLFTSTPIQERGVFGDAPLSRESGGVFAPKQDVSLASQQTIPTKEQAFDYAGGPDTSGNPLGERGVQAANVGDTDGLLSSQLQKIQESEPGFGNLLPKTPEGVEIVDKSRFMPGYKELGIKPEMTYKEYFTELGGGIKDLVKAPFSEDITARDALSQIGRAAAAKPYTTTALGLVGANQLGLLDGVEANPNLPGGYDQRGYELYMENPELYKSYVGKPEISYYRDRVRRMQEGGIAQNFPKKTGAINGPGTGTSDDIPAMLSDGEFVFTAKAVKNAGGGDRKKGANKMYSMMKSLERMG